MGYWLQNSLGNQGQSAVTIITRALVDANDSAFQNPSKPIGPFYKDKDELKKNHPDWNIVEDSGRGYRRVVPSPKPISILEAKQINDLVNNGQTIIAGCGGGIPVVKDQNGNFAGVEAVIDKDFTAAKIAELVDADELIILTAVDQAAINFNTPNQKNIGRININDLNLYLNQGQFGKGSMEPKIRASISFAEKTGKEAIITSLDNVSQFEKNGKATIIYK
ncbi:carbamate kinase [Fructilactobacillus sanfranciscensis]|uniref:amino acid kinase family protein n=1 Tax=Fructilactobacillus sanfranciscensis TaxID=1625 RepID=UPI002F264CD9|nr:carbamate kinase [Fructilactobacillus sanfranciscensis]